MNENEVRAMLLSPIKLNPGSFVDESLTPWGGRVIGNQYKSNIIKDAAGKKVGESWEFSISDDKHQSFDSLTKTPLKVFFEQKDLVYGELSQKSVHEKELLVKLLDAAQELSFQVHPADDFLGLKDNECGKPESWLILERKPGAGVYLGFKEGIDFTSFKAALQEKNDIKEYLQYVEVEKYDYVRVPVTTPHAIGAGVTLLEPQYIKSDKKGKTFRISDFGRKYDRFGELDNVNGTHRELHLKEALELIDPSKQSGKEYISELLVKPEVVNLKDGIDVFHYSNTVLVELKLLKFSENRHAKITLKSGYLVFFMASGQVEIMSEGNKTMQAFKGETFFVANAVEDFSISSSTDSEIIIIGHEDSVFEVS